MATMSDVAKRAGVALSTVSHALSGKRPISDETKQRIFKAMADLDYQPHALARSLATRHSQIVALLLPPANSTTLLESQFAFVASAAETVRKMGYNLLLWTSPVQDMDILQMLQQGFVEGLILMEVSLHDSRVEALKERGYPFSLIGQCENNDGISLVDLDFEDALQQSVSYVAGLGHRTIGLIAHSPALIDSGYGPAVRSLRGFQNAIATCDVSGFVRGANATPNEGYEVARTALIEYPMLSAFIVLLDSHLSGVVQAVWDAGLRIPEDFSIIGIMSPASAQLPTLAVTSLDFPMADMGRIGAELLIQQLDGEPVQPQQLVLRPALTIRQSTGPCKRQLAD
jgi:DNA-binding LacI/PurR family transcriptional regulator